MHEDLHRLETEVTKALAGLDPSQAQAAPLEVPGKWSIQQIVEHLLSTYRASIVALEARIEKRSGTRAKPSLRQRVGQFLIISLGQFPYGRAAPAEVTPSTPSTIRGGDDLAQRVSVELAKIDQLTARGEHLFSDRRAVSHLILGPLSMRQWRRFHLIHGLHHLKQIRAIRREHGF
jgi:hypothetical protein